MHGYVSNIEKLTEENNWFRQVLYTDTNVQLVVMALNVGEEIGEEVHDDADQFFRVESGEGKVVINGESHDIRDGSAVIVPMGARHNVINVGETKLKLYTLYTPPHHRDGVVHKTKAEAEADDEHFTGQTTE